MKIPVSTANVMVRLGLHLVQIYIAIAFVCWKMACFYINGESGLSFTFSASAWSMAVGAGYVVGVVVLLGHAALQIRSGLCWDSTRTVGYSGLGLLFLLLGVSFRSPWVNEMNTQARVGINILMVYYAFKGLRYFKTRTFVYWVWAYSINLAREVGFRWIDTDTEAGWFLELYWLGHIVSSVLMVAGMILLVRQLRSEDGQVQSQNTAKYVSFGILFLLIGIYPSLVFYGSPGIVTTCLANGVMLIYSIIAWRRLKIAQFALWAWASGITLAVMFGGQRHRTWFYRPWEFDATILDMIDIGNLIAGIFWVAGLVLILRYLSSTAPPRETTAGRVSDIALFPNPPAWMRKRLAIIIAVGGLAITITWLHQNDPAEVFSLEPKYEGHTLSYWMQHAYELKYGDEVALKTMGTKALPYLVKWMGNPARSSADARHRSWALKGFKVLGPTGAPAIPALIKMLGQNGGNYPSSALADIGTNAIPAVTARLLETVTATNGNKAPQRRYFGGRRPPSDFYLQRNLIEALSYMGTNAEAAVPALITYLENENARNQWEAAEALATIGHNRPGTVVPVLVQVLGSSTGYVRAGAAQALGSFGTNALSAIPTLVSAIHDPHPYVRTNVAAALKQIAPETQIHSP